METRITASLSDRSYNQKKNHG